MTEPSPRQILIVDDEPNVRLVFRAALEAAGLEVSEAADGPEALARLRVGGADLVLLDLRMPGMDGLDVLGRIRAGGDDVPVILVSAHGSVPDAVAAMRLGAIDFLAKPIALSALRDAVFGVLGRPAAGAAAIPAPPPAGPDLDSARRLLRLRRFDEAMAELEGAVRAAPGSAEAHNLMGVLHESRRDPEGAYTSYRLALKADRDYAPARNNMRRFYERTTFGRSRLGLDAGDGAGM